MRARCLLASASVAVAFMACQSEANAEPMDPALERLVANKGACGPDINVTCQLDSTVFARLVNQFGAAIAPTAMHHARTTGYGGFEFGIEGSFTTLDSGADYMRDGTRGATGTAENARASRNDSPDSVAQTYYLRIRKGLPLGFETTGLIGTMAHTSFVIMGADIRLALFEGFRTGVMGYLPDLAVGGGVRTITGNAQMQITTVGVDGQLSKPIAIAGSSIITPYVGYQYLWIFGDSGLVDTTPNTDALGYCGYEGQDEFGRPMCPNGSPADFNNTRTFDAARLQRQRIMFGVNYRFEMVTIGVQYLTDLVSPESMNKGDNLADPPSQDTISGFLGFVF